MGVTLPPLTIQFTEQTVVINAREPWLHGCLEQHLQSCLGKSAYIAATFGLSEEDGVFDYWRDDLLCIQTRNRGELLEPLMQEMITRLIAPAGEQLIVHAGAVALEEQGILLCGGSGCGKSTLTALLVANGFDYLTDEVVAIAPSLDVMEGFARSIVLKAGSDIVWQELERRPHSIRSLSLPNGVTWLAPHDLGTGSVRHQVQLSFILFIRYQRGANLEITPLSPAESSFQLLQQLANARNLPRLGLSQVSALAQQTPAYRASYGHAADLIRWLRDRVKDAG